MKLAKLATIGSLALLCSSAFAQAQTYTPGVAVTLTSNGGANLSYLFGENNLNAVYIGSAYANTTKKTQIGNTGKASFDLNQNETTIPLVVGYNRYYQIAPDKFDNKLFWNVGPYYARYFGTVKDAVNNDTYNNESWSAGLSVGLEYRLASNLSLGASTALYNHNVSQTSYSSADNVTTDSAFANGALYLTYQF